MLGQNGPDVPWYEKDVYGIPAGALLAISVLGIWVVIRKRKHKAAMLKAVTGKAGNRHYEKNVCC